MIWELHGQGSSVTQLLSQSYLCPSRNIQWIMLVIKGNKYCWSKIMIRPYRHSPNLLLKALKNFEKIYPTHWETDRQSNVLVIHFQITKWLQSHIRNAFLYQEDCVLIIGRGGIYRKKLDTPKDSCFWGTQCWNRSGGGHFLVNQPDHRAVALPATAKKL